MPVGAHRLRSPALLLPLVPNLDHCPYVVTEPEPHYCRVHHAAVGDIGVLGTLSALVAPGCQTLESYDRLLSWQLLRCRPFDLHTLIQVEEPSALVGPGAKDGQHKFIKEGGAVVAYTWDVKSWQVSLSV
jgi:hypothetical protein